MNLLTSESIDGDDNPTPSDFDAESEEHASLSESIIETVSNKETNLSFVSENTDLTKVKTKASARLSDTQSLLIEPENIIEYEWPEKSGDYFFIQEQISQLLDVKSFKRKYPDLIRRAIELQEREFLVEQKELEKVLPSHLLNNLTALCSIEVHELMSTEYPLIYAKYQKIVAERRRIALIEQQKELELIKSDTKKMEELRKKCIKNAAKFNSELQTIKKSERKFFYDIQTSIIQSSSNKWYRLPKKATRLSPYPVALIPSQYASHFRRFDSKELNRLPLNTIMENDNLSIPKRDISPIPIRVTEEELAAKGDIEINHSPSHTKDGFDEKFKESNVNLLKSARRSSMASNNGFTQQRKSRKNSITTATKLMLSELTNVSCSSASSPIPEEDHRCIICGMCENEIPLQDLSTDKPSLTPFVKCSECFHEMHSGCLGMPIEMVTFLKKYNWRCAECKECTICLKQDQEDTMVCCDFCDRGYHTFCIGLKAPPAGSFVCIKCEK